MKIKINIEVNSEGMITGKSACKIKTTYGILPEDLERITKRKVDMTEYKKEFDGHRKISAKSSLKKFGHKSKKWT